MPFYIHAGFKFLDRPEEKLESLLPNDEIKKHFRYEPYFACVYYNKISYKSSDDSNVKSWYMKWSKKSNIEGIIKYFYCSEKILVAVIYISGQPFWVTLALGNNTKLQDCKLMAHRGDLGPRIDCDNIKVKLECYKITQ